MGIAMVLALSSCGSPDTLPNSSYKLQPGDEISRDDLIDEKRSGWDEISRLDENTLEVMTWSGDENCYGFRAEVIETPEDITITVFEGRKPRSKFDPMGTKCLAIGRHAALIITTEDPIGDRTVIHPEYTYE